MTVTSTSIRAYYEARPWLKTQRDRVLQQIALDGPDGACIADIAEILGLQKSSVSPRFGELRKGGYLKHAGVRPSKTTHKEDDHWRVTDAGYDYLKRLEASKRQTRQKQKSKPTNGWLF